MSPVKKLFQRQSRLLFFWIEDYKDILFSLEECTKLINQVHFVFFFSWVTVLLHFPWYCAVRSGCLLHLALRSAHSFRYVFPSEPHTGPLKVTLEQSGAHTQRGLFRLFILHLFPGPQSTLSQVSVESIKKVMNNWHISSVYINICGLSVVMSFLTDKGLHYIYAIYHRNQIWNVKLLPDYFQSSKWWKHSSAVPLQGMQFGAPPLKISHRKSVLLGTSSSVHAVPRRPLLQQSSRLIPDMYRTWHLPFLPCWSQQLPAGKSHFITPSYRLNTILLIYHAI
jgi:hypothetical protein